MDIGNRCRMLDAMFSARPRCFVFLLSFATLASASALTLHVSPTGEDSASGTQEHPLASLTGARDALRKLRAVGPLDGGARVIVSDGEYTLTAPLALEPQDSGREGQPVIFEAAAGAHPLFSGGVTRFAFDLRMEAAA